MTPDISLIHPAHKLLNDAGIERAIKNGLISVNPRPTSDQVQPATLDLMVGKVKLYDEDVMKKTVLHFSKCFSNDLDAEPTDEFAKIFEDKKDIPIDLPSNSFVEIYLHENVQFSPENYDVEVDLRSSRGKLGFSLQDMFIHKEKDGFYIAVWNKNPNPIRLYGQDKFAQLFFYPKNDKIENNGYVVTNPGEAKDLASMVCKDKVEVLGSYLVFTLGSHILKFRKGLGVIDTREKYSDDFLYDKISTDKPVDILPGEAVITQLNPRLDLPSDVGIKILHKIPFAQTSGSFKPNLNHILLEDHAANAGWVDPGYSGNVTAHPLYRKWSVRVKKGDNIVFGVFYRYTSNTKRAYGSKGLDSHYQNSDGVGVRS